LSAFDPGLRRVSVQAGTTVVDLALPAGMPVASLIPSIVDLLGDGGRFGEPVAKRYQLHLPGAAALSASTTLAQSDIQDGTVLVLSQPAVAPPAERFDDAAEAVSATVDRMDDPWDRKATQLTAAVAACGLTGIGGLALVLNTLSSNLTRSTGITPAVAVLAGLAALLASVVALRTLRNAIAGLALNLIATEFASIAGFLAVPGASVVPNVLLAAVAAAVTSVLAMRVTGCGVITLTATACFAIVVATAALVAVLTAASLHVIGSVCTLASLVLLGLAGRISIILSGLSPRLSPAAGPAFAQAADDCLNARAIRADRWLTGLVAAFASAAAAGATATELDGTSRSAHIGFAAITGALLLLRAHHDSRRAPVLATTGIITTAATFAVAAVSAPERGPWIAAVTVTLAAVAVHLGFVAPTISFSPVLRRSVVLLECVALVTMVPLTCWICGLYGIVRGLNPH